MRIGQNLAMAVSTASIATILFIATAGGLAIESRSALPATIRSAARHYYDPSLDSMPGPSVSSDLRADANGKILAFAAIIASTDHRLPDLSNHRDAVIVHLTSPCLCHDVYPAHDSPDYLAPFLADADGNLSSIATIVAATDHHLPDPLQYRDAVTSHPFLTRSISIPDQRATQHWRATELLADADGSSSFAATNARSAHNRACHCTTVQISSKSKKDPSGIEPGTSTNTPLPSATRWRPRPTPIALILTPPGPTTALPTDRTTPWT